MKKRLSLTVVVICILLMITMMGGCGEYKKNILGSWSYQVSVEEQVEEKLAGWIEPAFLSECIDVHDYIPDISVTVVLQFDEAGNWKQYVDEASYNEAASKSMEAYKNAFMELLLLRAVNEGNLEHEDTAGITHEENLAKAEELFVSVMGMSFEDYAKENCEPLLPGYENMNNLYSASGTYKINGKTVNRSVSVRGYSAVEIEMEEEYLLNDDVFIFTECISNQNIGITYPCSYAKVK